MRPETAREALRVLNGGAPADASVPARTLAEVVEVFRHWLYLPDPAPLYATLAAVAANALPGDPVWLLLVGPPGGGKSEILQSTIRLPGVHPAATLTEPALLSGTAKKERAAAAKGGLLRQIGDRGVILCKDFGSVLSMNRDARAAVLAALREVYDGSWTRHVGTDGGQTLHWEGKVGLVAGCTPTIDRHHAVMGAMGERFVLLRLAEAEAAEQARRSLAHAGREGQMRAALADAVAGLFVGDWQSGRRGELTEPERERLVALTTLVVRCRSAVERDSYSREIELVPGSEAPGRLIVVLSRLLVALDVIGLGPAPAWELVTRLALDSMPALRRAVIDVLYATLGEATTTAVSEQIEHPTITARRTLEDLTAHGVVARHPQGKGRADTWSLTAWAREQCARTFPGMSEGA